MLYEYMAFGIIHFLRNRGRSWNVLPEGMGAQLYIAALVQNQFWHHSPFIAHNYGVTYATKTSHW